MKKDFNILNYFNTRALFMGIGLSRIISQAHEYSYISIILGTLIGLFLLYLLKLEMKNSFINILLNSCIIIMSLVLLINMISTMYLTKMPKLLIGLPFVLLLLYLLNKKEIVLYRLSGIMLFFNLLCYLFAFFSLSRYFTFDNFYYTNVSIKSVVTCALEFALYSITPTFLTRNSETKDINIYKMYLVSCFTMGIIFMLTYGILGANVSSIVRYPEYLILKEVSLTTAIQNIENIVSYMWIIDVFILLASCGNSIKNNVKNKWVINIILPILLFITTYMNDHYEFILVLYKFSPFILAGVLALTWLTNKKLIFNR
ncbi:MAG: hypothetical protein HFI73_06135 [Bacilli bacterium]|jgi:hypothetical protein|nr:hypothetical protein [Bacilli bacterium]